MWQVAWAVLTFWLHLGILKVWVAHHLHQNPLGYQEMLGILFSVERGDEPYYSLDVKGLACFVVFGPYTIFYFIFIFKN